MNIGVSKTQQRIQAKYAAQQRWIQKSETESPPRADATMMAIANFENGSTYTKSKGILAAQGIESPPQTTYFRHQKKVGNKIKQLCNESLQEEAAKMEEGTVISCDAAFAHRRNSSQCHGAFINAKTGKIVAGSVVTKERKGGDFKGASNMMETEMISRNLKQIDTSKVIAYCHDRDNKTPQVMTNNNPNMIEKIDPNHGKKWFQTGWNALLNGSYRLVQATGKGAMNVGQTVTSFVSKQVSKVKNVEYRSLFRSVKKHVEAWFVGILYDKEIDSQAKKDKWQTIENHIIGDHSKCTHDPNKETFVWKKAVENKELRKDFHRFVDDMSKVFDRVDPYLTTNPNESLHAFTAKIADKNTAWSKDGYESRIAYAYLHHNKPNDCSVLIRQRCNAKTNQVDLQHIAQKNEQREKVKAARCSPIYRRQENERRKQFRKSMKSKPGDYIGVPLLQLKKESLE